MLSPHLKDPLSAISSSISILNNMVIDCSFFATKAILSFLRTVKFTLSRSLTPSTVFDNPSTVRISLPTSLSISNPTKGYRLLDAGSSSTVSLSSSFFLEVACLDFDLLAENRSMNDCSSLAFSSFFLFCCFFRR